MRLLKAGKNKGEYCSSLRRKMWAKSQIKENWFLLIKPIWYLDDMKKLYYNIYEKKIGNMLQNLTHFFWPPDPTFRNLSSGDHQTEH